MMELYQQFLQTEAVIKTIAKQIEEHRWATLQEICNTIGNVRIIRPNREEIESTHALSGTPGTEKRQAKVSIHSSRCEHSPLNRTKTYQDSGCRSPLTVLKDTGKSKRQVRSGRKSSKQPALANVSRTSRNICDQSDSHTLKENTPEAKTAVLEQKRRIPVDAYDDDEPPRKRASYLKQKTVSTSNESNAGELPASRIGEKEASFNRLCEEDENLPLKKAVPEKSPNTRWSRSKKTVSTSNESNAGELPASRIGEKEASFNRLCEEDENLPLKKAVPEKSPNTRWSRSKNVSQNGVHHSSYSVDSKVKHVSRLLTGRSHQTTTFGNKVVKDYNTSRLFSSAERLGGVSRLHSLGRSVLPSKGKTDWKMNSIKERTSANTSLNCSTVKQTNRSTSSVLSAKEKILEEKRKLVIEQMEKKNERLRAFQEEKRLKAEARKKANDERFLAAHQRYQQLLQGNQFQVKENLPPGASTSVQAKPLQSNSATASSTTTTTATNNNPAKKCLVSLNTKDHNKVLRLQNKPVSVMKPSQPASCQKVQPMVKVHTNQPVGQSQLQKKVVEPKAVPVISSPVVEEPFNISKCNSDSESDDEDSGGHCPEWCRKGNTELMDAFCDLHSIKMRWQDEFLPASMIPFSIPEIFRDYDYTLKPRTSSAIWDESPRSSGSNSANRPSSSKIPLPL
ncbi:unnamed protein product [Trichobilharzia szidati]|nr:unnamed protein product [Trichobilharzia szidati]